MHTISSSSVPWSDQTHLLRTNEQEAESSHEERKVGLGRVQEESFSSREEMMKEISLLNRRLELNEKELTASRLTQKLLLEKMTQLESTLISTRVLKDKMPFVASPLPFQTSSSNSSQSIALAGSATPPIAENPSLAFGKREWELYFGEIGEEPPLPSNISEILRSPCPFWFGKRVEETHLLTLIPAMIKGEPLSLDMLEELIKAPKSGARLPGYRYYWDRLKEEYGKRGIESSYWVLMTREVIEGSRNKSYDEQRLLLETQARAHPLLMEVRVPSLLEAAVSILMEHAKTGTKFYNDSPLIYTRCQEAAPVYQLQTVVGGFGAIGLDLFSYVIVGDVGLAGSWKL